MSIKSKVILLIGPNQHHFSTAKILIEKKVYISGIVVADKKSAGINLNFLKIILKKHGIVKVFFQILERVFYKFLNSKKDKNIYNKLFPKNDKNIVINSLKSDQIIFVTDYDKVEVSDLILKQKPDFIIIHTPFWVSKKIRDLVGGRVLGGHPGITQKYRGIHSPFWAIYNNDLKNIGYTVFWVTNGVDSGEIIDQGFIKPNKDDSYISLSWRGMKEIALSLPRIIKKYEYSNEIVSKKNNSISKNTLYYHPTIFNYIYYRYKSNVR